MFKTETKTTTRQLPFVIKCYLKLTKSQEGKSIDIFSLPKKSVFRTLLYITPKIEAKNDPQLAFCNYVAIMSSLT